MKQKKEFNIKIGANIQRAREQSGYTQDKLSELLDITPNHLSAIERGIYSISIENLQKLCRLLNVSADFIVFGDTPSNEEIAIAQKISAVHPMYKSQVLRGIDVLLSLSDVKFFTSETSTHQ